MEQSSSAAGRIDVTIATNNGDIGGGEVMLLRIAAALRANGERVTIVAPSEPSHVAELARDAGYATVVLDARDRVQWMRALRHWDARERDGLLWCNGLVPSVATAGHKRRIVHLHQRPSGAHRILSILARAGAAAVVVPSESMRKAVPRSKVMPNWTEPVATSPRVRPADGPFVVGFLGRVSADKGIDVLAVAMQTLEQTQPGAFRLAIAGEPRFVSKRSRAAVETALAGVSSLTEQHGWIEPADFFSRIDLLAVPSVVPESFGLVAAEAMAANVPVVVSDAGALPEVVGLDHALVVPVNDPVALADAIRSAARDGQLADVAAQHERWRSQFSPEVGTRHVRELIDEVVAGL